MINLSIVFIPIIARFYIKEKFSIIHLIALVISILGVFFIAQPSFLFKQSAQLNTFNNQTNSSINLNILNEENRFNRIFGISIGLFSALLSGIVAVLLKKLTNQKVHYSVAIIYATYIGLPVSLLISLIMYLTGSKKINLELVQDVPSILYQIAFGLSSGLFGVFSQIAMNFALKYDDTTKVSMFRSTDLLFSFIFQYVLLNISVNLFSVLGACLIFFATIFLIIFQILEKYLSSKDKVLATKNKDQSKNSFVKKFLFFKF